jgi:hypothetical protein
MSAKAEYIPGVCNIGPAEIRRRRQSGWIGSGAAILLWGAFWIFRVPAPWRLSLFFPAMIGATGFLQAAFHFCAGFGMRGVFNFGAQVGKTDTVEQAEFRLKDRSKARLIGLYSALIGFAVAIAGFFVVLPRIGGA